MRAFQDELADRIREVSSRCEAASARSALLVDASRYLRLREAYIPRCAWCGKVGLGGRWVRVEDVPHFLLAELEGRTTHGICPECFPAWPERRTTEQLAVHAGGRVTADALAQALGHFGVTTRPDFVLEASVPRGDQVFVNRLLSRIADCLTAYELEPVQVRLGRRTYTLTGR